MSEPWFIAYYSCQTANNPTHSRIEYMKHDLTGNKASFRLYVATWVPCVSTPLLYALGNALNIFCCQLVGEKILSDQNSAGSRAQSYVKYIGRESH